MEKEEKEGLGFIGNAVQIVILAWSLAVISWSYFNPNPTRQIRYHVRCRPSFGGHV